MLKGAKVRVVIMYQEFAKIYDEFMQTVPYTTWADYIETIWNNGTAPVGLPKVNNIQHVGWKDYGVTVNGSAVDYITVPPSKLARLTDVNPISAEG